MATHWSRANALELNQSIRGFKCCIIIVPTSDLFFKPSVWEPRLTVYPCYHAFFDKTPSDTVILTPNFRLSRFVQGQYQAYQQTRQKAWSPLQCLPINAFVQSVFDANVATLTVLESSQVKALWQAVGDAGLDDGVSKGAFVSAAQSAYDRLRLGGVALQALEPKNEEQQLFVTLAEQYQALLDDKAVTDTAGVLVHLVAHFSELHFEQPRPLVLLGFDDLAPLLQTFVKRYEQTVASVTSELLTLPAEPRRRAFASDDDELKAAIHWAYAKLQSDSTQTVALVVPDLAKVRPKMERMLVACFEPHYAHPDVPQHPPGFNISAGQPLAQTPVIRTAMALLNFVLFEQPVARVLELLQAPFLWGPQAPSPATFARLGNALRAQYLSLTLKQFSAFLASFIERQPEVAPLFNGVQALLEVGRARASAADADTLSHAEWVTHWVAQLTAISWPGPRALDTYEFQQIERWREVLTQFALLDDVLPHCTQTHALTRLNQMLFTPFLVQTAASPLQVLGVLEASGMHFDALWVTGLTDNTWPEPCQPNPLLPIGLQKQHNMPRASVDREFELAQKITERFAQSATEVVFSYALWQGDEPLRPSPLIEPYPLDETVVAGAPDAGPDEAPDLEWLTDANGTPLAADQTQVKGGSGVLKDQAACAFRAYAKHRLGAISVIEKVPGVSPLLRGNLIHAALETVWTHIGSHQALLALEDDALQSLVDNTLIKSWLSLPARDLGPNTQALELERCGRLIHDWLALEKARSPFVVETHEKSCTGVVGPLTLSLRLDRLDRLADGTCVVIDYKTGAAEIKQWLGERLDEPQVPLYCVLTPKVAAAVFGKLATQEVAAIGLAERDDIWASLKMPEALPQFKAELKTWADLLLDWRTQLEQLATQFSEGAAGVDPKNGDATCRYCDLQSVCRLHMQTDGSPIQEGDWL